MENKVLFYDIEDLEIIIDLDEFPEVVTLGKLIGVFVPCIYKGNIRGNVEELIGDGAISKHCFIHDGVSSYDGNYTLRVDLAAFVMVKNGLRVEEIRNYFNEEVDMETMTMDVDDF